MLSTPIMVGFFVVVLFFLYYMHDNANYQSEAEIDAKITCGLKQCGMDEYGNNCGTCRPGYNCLAHQCINDLISLPMLSY